MRNLLNHAKRRAVAKGRDFDIGEQDLTLPPTCPVLGIPLNLTPNRGQKDQDNSPSLDRIDGSGGYVRGNVLIVSGRANRLKSDGTSEEHRKIADFYERLNEANI